MHKQMIQHRVSSPMKTWLRDQDISYRRLAEMLGQSASSICLKVNGRVDWQADDLLRIYDLFGLSSDFVLGISSILETRAMHPAGSAFRSLDAGGGTS